MSDDCWPSPADYETAATHAIELLHERHVEARMVGSYARGEHQAPYSDLDVLAIAPTGRGAEVRDLVVEAAHSLPGTLCVTIDPLDHQAIIYSTLAHGLQIDWFVAERTDGVERAVWRGELHQPVSVVCRAWSSLLYTLSLLLRGADTRVEAARALGEHWAWLSANGIDVRRLPPYVPGPDDDLFELVERTALVLPLHPRLGQIFEARVGSIAERR